MIHQDVMEKKLTSAEGALRDVEQKFQALLDISTDAVVITDVEGSILHANFRAAAVFGHDSPDDLVGMPGLELLAPGHQEHGREGILQALQNNGRADVLHTLVRGDGTRFEGRVNAATVSCHRGSPAWFVVTIQDMTKTQKAEQAVVQYQVWLRRMAADLVLAEERERRRIASELHDRVGQNLALCRMKLSALEDSPPAEGTARPMAEIADLLDHTLQDVRTLTVELSPPILYELSFEDAVSWLGDRTRERAQIEVKVEDDGQPKPLSEDVGIFLFKAIQELLINVTKHAGASTIKVSLKRKGQLILVEVEDDGAGFDVKGQDTRLEASSGFGLFSIRERLTPLGGSIHVSSHLGQGTRVTLTAPVDERQDRS